MNALEALPVIKGEPEAGFDMRRLLSRNDREWVRRVERVFDRLVALDAVVVLRNAVQFGIRDWNREQTVLGRILNRLMVADVGYVRVPGHVLAVLLAGETGGFDRREHYLLRVDVMVGLMRRCGAVA